MENISQITDMLELEIEKFKSDKDELEQAKTLNDLYEDIIGSAGDINKIINNKEAILIILDTFDKDIALQLSKKLVLIQWYQQKNLIDLDEYKNAIKIVNNLFGKIIRKNEEIKDKIADLNKRINANKGKIKLFEITLKKIKYKQYIPYKIVKFLDNFFQEKEISQIEQIKFLEIINIYNRNIYEKIHHYSPSYKNEVLDMLSFGFEIIEDNSLDYNQDIAKKADLHYSLLKYQDDFKQYFEEIRQEILNENDLKLFFIIMIQKLQEQILENITLIKDKDFYVDLDTKKEIVNEFKRLTSLSLKFRKEYFNIISKDDEVVETSDIKVIFAQDSNGKTYFLKDLKNINNEYLPKVLDLITSLINGTLTNKNIEGFTSLYKDFRKLKDDQIRIVLHPINPKLYCIMGVGVKKNNTGNIIYKTLCGRKYPTNETEISRLLESSDNDLEYIEQYIMENKRKGNR